jgi:hypothetical protein
MKKTVCIVFALVCLHLAGCYGYEVKGTDGLRVACEKILLANYLLDETSARKDLPNDTRKHLMNSYNKAALSVNSFLDAIEEKSANVVDVPVSVFYTNIASSDLDRFISDATVARAKSDSGQDEKVDQTARTERQRKEVQRFQDILVSANAKARGIMELNSKKSGESYKMFKGQIESLKMNVLPQQTP